MKFLSYLLKGASEVQSESGIQSESGGLGHGNGIALVSNLLGISFQGRDLSKADIKVGVDRVANMEIAKTIEVLCHSTPHCSHDRPGNRTFCFRLYHVRVVKLILSG